MTEPQGGADPKVFTTSGRAGRRRVGDQRREVVLVVRRHRRVHHRHGRHRPRRPALRAPLDVRGAPARRPASTCCATSASATSRWRRRARGLRPLRGRAGARRPHARPPGRRVRRGPDPPRRRAHPPRHAHRRAGAADLRHALRAGRVPPHPGRDAGQQAARAGDDRRLVDGDRGLPPADPADGVEDRPATTTTRRCGPTSRR